MGQSLNGQQISTTYDALIKLNGYNPANTTYSTLCDGVGNNIGVDIATDKTRFTLPTTFTNTVTFNGTVNGLDTDEVTEGSTNKYYSTTLFNNDFNTKTITNTVNSLSGDLTLSGGTDVIITDNGSDTITISVTGGGGGSGTSGSSGSSGTSGSSGSSGSSGTSGSSGSSGSSGTSGSSGSSGTSGSSGSSGTSGSSGSSGSSGTSGTSGPSWTTSGLPGYVATYESTTGITPENKLIFANSYLDILSTNSVGGMRLYGGVLGAVSPTISTSGSFSNIFVDTNLVMTNQNRISFDSDFTNTYIAADTDNPENLEIHADNNIQLFGNVEVNNNLSVGTITDVEQSILDLESSVFSEVITITGSSLVIDDANINTYKGKTILCDNATSFDFEIDTTTTPSENLEFYLVQYNTAQPSIINYAGNIYSSVGGAPTTRAQYSSCVIKHIGSNNYLVIGDIE